VRRCECGAVFGCHTTVVSRQCAASTRLPFGHGGAVSSSGGLDPHRGCELA